MKISDLVIKEQIDEGFGDFVKRTGLMGQDNKQSAMSKQQDERAKSIGLKDFTYKLNSALQSAIKGGIVALPNVSSTSDGSQPATSGGRIEPTLGGSPTASAGSTQPGAAAMNNMVSQLGAKPAGNTMANAPVSKTNVAKKPEPSMAELLRQRQQKGMTESQYKLFNQLIESQILNEAEESVSQFITRFIDTQTRNLVDSPNYQQNINMIAKKLEDQYTKNKGLDPKLVEQAWETIWAWSQLGKKRSAYNSGNQIVDMDHDGTDDSIERATDRKKLLQKINKTDFNDPDQLKLLAPDVKNLWDMIQGIK